MSRRAVTRQVISNLTESEKTKLYRANTYNTYLNKYYNIFMNGYDWKNLSYEQKEYVMRQLWEVGTFAVFNLEVADLGIKDNEGKDFVFCPYATNWYNTYHFPISCFLINTYAVSFIPKKLMYVNEDVVLCWAQHSHTPIKDIVEYYVNKLVDIDMSIRTNLLLQKMPFVLKSTPENYERLKNIFEALEDDKPCISLSSEDLDAIDSLSTATPYVIDKLYSYKVAIENELLTILGIDNIGNIEKKERLVADEANSNNDVINDFGDSVLDNLKAFCESAKKYLKIDISVEAKNTPVSAVSESPKVKKGAPKNGNNL